MSNFDNPAIGRRGLSTWWVAAAVLGAISLIYSGVWFYLAMGARESVTQWIEEQRTRGFAVRYDSLEATGFPSSIRLELENPGFGAPEARIPWGWEGAHLRLIFKPWDFDYISAITSGSQMLAFPLNGGTAMFDGAVGNVWVDVRLSGGYPSNTRIRLKGVDLKQEKSSVGKIRITAADFVIDRSEATLADHRSPSWFLEGSADSISLPWFNASPLGDEVKNLTIDGRLMGNLEAGPLIESLENWRDSGGTVELKKINVQNGPLKISADGTLALDGLLQPIGALTARIEGFFQTVDALQRLGLVKPRDAVTAKMVLGVLARKPEGGGPARLNLALTLQERRLYAGPVGLMEIPEVQWRKTGR